MHTGVWTMDCGLWTVDYGLWIVYKHKLKEKVKERNAVKRASKHRHAQAMVQDEEKTDALSNSN